MFEWYWYIFISVLITFLENLQWRLIFYTKSHQLLNEEVYLLACWMTSFASKWFGVHCFAVCCVEGGTMIMNEKHTRSSIQLSLHCAEYLHLIKIFMGHRWSVNNSRLTERKTGFLTMHFLLLKLQDILYEESLFLWKEHNSIEVLKWSLQSWPTVVFY